MRWRLVGVYWFHRESYAQCRAIMDDGEDDLPAEYSEWLDRANEYVLELESEGREPFKVLIDPQIFSAWCRERMLSKDHRSRVRYANLITFGKTMAALK